MALDINAKRQFLDLACRLSPENLTCDGEISSAEVHRRYRQIQKEWSTLEKSVGRKVEEGETWGWSDEIRKANEEEAQRRLVEAEKRFGKLPGLRMIRSDDCRTMWSFDGGKVSTDSDNRWAAFSVCKNEKGVIDMGQFQIPVEESGFKVTSEFASTLNRSELVGEYPTLEEAHQAGLDFLKTVTFSALKEKTQFTDENIRRALRRLPENMQQVALES